MTAISKAWVSIADSAVDPDSPLDTVLLTAIRDNLVHTREWLGAGYYAGAVQDHNHDGVNSALVEIGPNAIRNGSFEDDQAGWTFTPYTGGSVAINTANHMDGAKSIAITSTVLANGGGELISNEYRTITEGRLVRADFALKASVANVSCKVEVVWYNNLKAQISATTLYSSVNTPITLTRRSTDARAPSNARYYRTKVTGGVPGSGTATGTFYFDGLVAATGEAAEAGSIAISELTAGGNPGSLSLVAAFYVPRGGIYRFQKYLDASFGLTAQGRIYRNGVAYGVMHSVSAGGSTWWEDLEFQRGDQAGLYVSGGDSYAFRVFEANPTFGKFY